MTEPPTSGHIWGLPRFLPVPANLAWEGNGEFLPFPDVEGAGIRPVVTSAEDAEIVGGMDAGTKGVKLSGGVEVAEVLRAIWVVV